MSAFGKVKGAFGADWTTLLVGWSGLGELSPWPDRWIEFPSLISVDEIAAYAEERLARSPGPPELDLVVALLSPDVRSKTREEVRALLTRLSELSGGDPSVELRKWRVVLLEEVLAHPPKDALHGLAALSEFWQSWGFPTDSPHDVQGRGNATSPSEYYQEQNLRRAMEHHRAWLEEEKESLRNPRAPA